MSRRNENIFEEKSHLGRKIGVTLLVVLLLMFGAGAVANFAISNTVKTLRQTVTIPDLPNSLDQWSILLLTDLNGEYRGLNQASIGKAVGTRAVSCVIMTGNMIGENGDAAPALALLEQLPAGSKVLFLPGSGDPSPYATTAHASLSPYADWAQALIDAGVTMLDVPVSFTREKSTIWFVPEDLYTLNIPSARKAYQKQLDGLNALPTLTADQAALQRLAVYQLDRLDRIEAAMAEMTNKDMQVCVSGMPLTQEYITTAKQNADPKAVCAMNNVDLIVTGGYCGGQWRIPGVGALYVPELGWFPEDSQVQGLKFFGGIFCRTKTFYLFGGKKVFGNQVECAHLFDKFDIRAHFYVGKNAHRSSARMRDIEVVRNIGKHGFPVFQSFYYRGRRIYFRFGHRRQQCAESGNAFRPFFGSAFGKYSLHIFRRRNKRLLYSVCFCGCKLLVIGKFYNHIFSPISYIQRC